jgi:ferredoxin
MAKIIVRIDPSICILAANCVGIEPKLFQIRQESHVELIDDAGASHGTEYTFDAADAQLEMIEEAVESCPTRAISMQYES